MFAAERVRGSRMNVRKSSRMMLPTGSTASSEPVAWDLFDTFWRKNTESASQEKEGP